MLTLKQAIAAALSNGEKSESLVAQSVELRKQFDSFRKLTADAIIPHLKRPEDWATVREAFAEAFIAFKGFKVPDVPERGDKSEAAEAARAERKNISTQCTVYFGRWIEKPLQDFQGPALPEKPKAGKVDAAKQKLAQKRDIVKDSFSHQIKGADEHTLDILAWALSHLADVERYRQSLKGAKAPRTKKAA